MNEESKSNTSLTREISVFSEALKLCAPADRAAYLDRECAGDAPLRAAVESLLRHHQDDQFMAKPGGTVRLSPVTEKPGDMIGRYKLMEQIGEGGFGVVYVAEQRTPVRRLVALKISKLGLDTRQVVARFEAERQALAMMDHPNIAKVLDGGATESGRPYFVMELVRGIKVTEYCDHKKLTTRQRLDLFMQICRAVQHAHQKGVIHRDLKPSNILVTLHDGVPVPKVIDFGIAKATQGHLTDKTIYTNFQQFMGTPAYMSPEQAEMSGLDIDTRSDLYSLGVLLYELLTGGPPFDETELLASGLDAMRRTIREQEPPRPSTRLGTLAEADLTLTARRHGTEPPKLVNLVRGDLDWIVMKCLEKDRARRYESASGLAADIERHINNEPIVARPPSQMYRLQKMVRRNKVAFTAGTAVAVSVLVGLGVSSWLLVKERQARQLAVAEARRADHNAALETEQRRIAESNLETNRMLFAYSLHDGGQFDDATAYLTKILSLHPTNDAALSHLATLLVYGSAFTNALEREPDFSSDGKRLLVYPTNYIVQICDAETGQPLSPPITNAGDQGASFSPDGKRLLVYPTNHIVQVWNAETGQPLSPPITNAANQGARLSPDGKRLLVYPTNDIVQVWNAETGQPLSPPITNAGNQWASFSPDGKRLLVSPTNDIVQVWNVETGQPLSPPITDAGNQGASFSPDGKRLLVYPTNHIVQVWNVETGQPLFPPITNAGDQGATLSPDGKRLLVYPTNDIVQICDAETGQPLSPQITNAAKSWARFSPDWSALALVSATVNEDGVSVEDTWENTGHVTLLDVSTGRILAEMGRDDGRAEMIVEGKKFIGGWKEPRNLLITSILITSNGWPLQVCELYPKNGPCPDWVLQLAEAVSGLVLNDQGLLEKTKMDRAQTINDIRARLNKDTSEDDWVVWGRWLLADPSTRCFTPFYARNARERIKFGMPSRPSTNNPAP